MYHKFFFCVCLSSFVAHLWCVVFVVLTVFSLSLSLLLLILHALFVIIDESLFFVCDLNFLGVHLFTELMFWYFLCLSDFLVD